MHAPIRSHAYGIYLFFSLSCARVCLRVVASVCVCVCTGMVSLFAQQSSKQNLLEAFTGVSIISLGTRILVPETIL